MNKINVSLMLDILRKATCNYSIDNISLSFTNEHYKSSMRGPNCIIILENENDVITNISSHDKWSFYFRDVSKNVKTYFDLIIPDENDEVTIQNKEEKIVLISENQRSNIFFCSENRISSFNGNGPRSEGDIVYESIINQNFIDSYQLVKRIGSSFGKIYLTTEDKKLNIEATDKTNSYSNGMKMNIGESEYPDDITLCFEFKTFNNIMTLINGDFEDFVLKIGYKKENEGGMVSFIKNDGSEKYYLLSIRER